MPMPMAWEVVLSDDTEHKVRDLRRAAFSLKKEFLSMGILFSMDIKGAFVKTDAPLTP